MITIPVLIGHRQSKVIGHMTIDETQLPEFPDYCFTLGFIAEDFNLIGKKPVVTKYKLLEVSVTSDENYTAFLKNNE